MNSAISVSEVADLLEADIHTKRADLDRKVSTGCASDLMSDVLAYSKPRSILVTGLNTVQTVRTAEVADLLAICFAFGKIPEPKTVELAEVSNIPLMTTALSLFSASGRLYERGLGGGLEKA